MISPDEFLRRCERVKVEFAVEGRERQQLTCELAALCALTGARAESLYNDNSQLTGLRVSDPGGNLVISGPVDEVLAELVAVPTSYQNGGPGRGARRRPRDSRTAAQQADQLAVVIQSWHSTVEFELPHLKHFAGEARPDTPRLDLVGPTGSGSRTEGGETPVAASAEIAAGHADAGYRS
jgi:hypothetical protein